MTRAAQLVEPVNPVISAEEIPADWDLLTIGQITEAVSKINPKDNPERQIEYIDISGIDNEIFRIAQTKTYAGRDAPSRARQLVQPNDIVFSTVRTYLKNFALVPPELDGQIASTGFCVLRASNEAYQKYLFYFVQFDRFLNELAKHQRGTSYPAVRDGDVKAQLIPVPPPEQAASIVAEIEKQFSRLDEAVASLKRVKANLKRYKAAVLKAAVEGKLTEEWRKQNPDVEPASKLLERILAERRTKWEEAELAKMKLNGKEPTNDKWKEKYKGPSKPKFQGDRPVPNNWEVASLAAVSNALGGYAFKSKLFAEGGLQIVKMANIKMGKLELNARPSFIQDVPEEIISKYRLVDGDILVTLTGTRKKRDYGYVVQVREPKNILLLNQRIARVRPYCKGLSEYLAIALESEEFRDRFFSHETGNVGQGNVGMKAISEEYILIPPVAEQEEVVKEWQRMDSMVVELLAVCERQILRSNRLRQSVLARAFSGGN